MEVSAKRVGGPGLWLKVVAFAAILAVVGVAVLALRRPAGEASSVLANGSVEATEIVLSAKIPGRLASVAFDEGNSVVSGAVVARIESDEVRAQLQAADAQVLAATAQVVAAENNVTELRRHSLEAGLAQSYAGATTTASITRASEAVTAAQHGVHAADAAFEKPEAT